MSDKYILHAHLDAILQGLEDGKIQTNEEKRIIEMTFRSAAISAMRSILINQMQITLLIMNADGFPFDDKQQRIVNEIHEEFEKLKDRISLLDRIIDPYVVKNAASE